MLDRCGGVQWPFPRRAVSPKLPSPSPPPRTRRRDAPNSQRRLFEDGRFFHFDHRARFVCETPREFPEQPNQKYPFVLLTGRGSASQWHTQTRTSKSAVLRKLYPQELYVEINPQDAQTIGVRSGDRVLVRSQRGALRARVLCTPALQPGQLFIPMHYEATNRLTHSAFDPYSHQPAYKACAVAVEVLTSSAK